MASDVQVFRGIVWDKRLHSGLLIFYALIFIVYVFNPGTGGNGLRIAVAI